MSLLSATLRLDVRIQARSRLYAIGIAVAVVLGMVARYVFDDPQAGRVLATLYLLGIGGTTYIYGASLLLLEKSQGTLQALRATPLTSNAYIGSKAVTLTTFALVESVIIYVIGFPGVEVRLWSLVLGVAILRKSRHATHSRKPTQHPRDQSTTTLKQNRLRPHTTNRNTRRRTHTH